jgi:Holliday junction resolvase RusA-like endonuclease
MLAGAPVSFTIPTPPSLNNLFKNLRHGRAATAEYKSWQQEAGYHLNCQRIRKIKTPVMVDITFPDEGGADMDNLPKALLDLCVKHKIIVNDSRKWVRDIGLHWLAGITLTRVVLTEAVPA